METTITATQLSRQTSEVLDRVKDRGERFVVKRHGETIATISPATDKPGITVRELIARIGDLKLPDDGFADALEAVQAAQGLAEIPEWPNGQLIAERKREEDGSRASDGG